MKESLRNAAIYCRISRDAEGEGLGVARQEQACRELADRLGLPIETVYTDNDIGASEKTNTKKQRTEWLTLVKAVEDGRYSHVISYSNSRLTRRMRELEDIIALHDRTGVLFLTVVSGNDDLSTADGRMVARIKASVDAAEADRISERTKAAHRQKAMKGLPKVAGNRPYGYTRDGSGLMPDEAKAIREAVDFILGGGTVTQVRRLWEQAGLQPTGGGKLVHSSIKRSLLGWRVAGIRTYKGEPVIDENGEYVRGTWPAIITLEERAKALSLISGRYRERKRQGKWLLSGLIRCGKCGSRLYGRFNGDPSKDVYACGGGDNHLAITSQRLESYVEMEVLTYVVNRAIYGFQAEESEEPTPQEWPGEERLKNLNGQIETLMDAFNSERLSGDVVFSQVDKLDQERRTLRLERDLFYANLLKAPKPISSGEEVLELLKDTATRSFEERQLLLTQELEQVVILAGKRGGGSHKDETYYGRVKIVWKQPHAEFGKPNPEVAPRREDPSVIIKRVTRRLQREQESTAESR